MKLQMLAHNGFDRGKVDIARVTEFICREVVFFSFFAGVCVSLMPLL